ncbi:amino acid adenylation domain-containing protein [Kitasatospora brasiliensis]|uniref:amino acid adenylation domain-containing protein n=1 Tax=Kitasatospora brasiliensis TaxID=3058040 RepID=UPI0029303B5D|nr:amino acid adenylation domain-containing protein [Kitasatospora sp. K002]
MEHAAVRAHWLTALRGTTREALLPVGGATLPQPAPVILPPDRATAARRLAGDDPTGLHLLLLAATRLTLARFGAADDLAILCPAPGGGTGELVLRTALGRDTKVSDFLQALHRDLTEAAALPWQDRAALATRLDAVGEAEGAALSQLAVGWGEARLATPAELLVHGRLTAEGGIALQVTGADGLVPAVAADLPRCLAATLEAIAADPYRTAGETDPLSPGHRAELEGWSGLPVPAAFAPRTLPALADASADRAPDRVAVLDGDLAWTHGDLAARSRAAARHLADRYGIRPGDRVAVALPRGADLVLAVLAVLRAGAAYVPIDPRHPAARIRRLVDGSAARLVIAADAAPADLPFLPAAELRTASAPTGAAAVAAPLPVLRPQDDAVVFFTSGSTGLPKPVVLRHDQIGHHVTASAELLGVDEGLRCALLSAISSDATTFQIFLALAVGGSLAAVGAPDELDPVTFWERLRATGVTMVNCVPSLLSTMLEVLPTDAGIELPYLLLGGDTVPRGLPARTRGRLRIGTLANLYGPSEATIACATFHCPGERAVDLAAVPIGRPTPGFAVLVLTPSGDLAPVGVPGEMYVAGPAVAVEGYLDAPEATAARFVECPLPGVGRVFRTGDLARWNADGTLDFLGRMDDQIQLHGNRVEPGEVEQTMVGLDGVREAVVLSRAVGTDGLVLGAWYTVDDLAVPEKTAPEAVRAALAELLPAHMVPGLLRRVAELPRTPHGKIDRLALAAEPAPETAGSWTPEDEAGRAVAAAWETVFGRPPRSADEDFFEAGGHSLSAAQLVGALCAGPTAQELSIRQVFAARTPGALSEALREAAARGPARPAAARPAAARPAADRDRPSRWPATHAQARLWLLESLDEGEVRTYNMVEAYQPARALDPAALEAALGYLVDRHEALRTVFEMSAERGSSELWQVVRPAGKVRVRPRFQRVAPEAFDAALAEARAQELRQPFDLAAGPLIRLRCLTTAGRPPVLLLNVHHAVNDGWSYGVLIRDLLAAVRAFEQGRKPDLPEPAGYLAHARALDARLADGRGEEHAAYWRTALAGLPPAPALPGDRIPGPRRANAGAFARVGLGERVTDGVRALAVRGGATPFMVYTAAVRALLYRLTGAADLALGTVSAGRAAPELAHELGLFVNTVVLRTAIDPTAGFTRLVEDCVRTALDAAEHEEYPFDRLVRDLGLPRDQGRNPVFDVLVETVISGTGEASPADGGESVRHLRADEQVSDFDLSFSFLIPASGSAEEAEVWVGHRSDLFSREAATRLGERLRALLVALLDEPTAPLGATL